MRPLLYYMLYNNQSEYNIWIVVLILCGVGIYFKKKKRTELINLYDYTL